MNNKQIHDQGVKLLSASYKEPENKQIWFDGIHNKWFRLNSLYDIKDKSGRQIQLKPNLEQADYFVRSHNRDVILKARQLGFTTFCMIDSLDSCLFIPYYSAACIAHTLDDVKAIFDDKVKFAYENLSHSLISYVTDGQFHYPTTEKDSVNTYKFSNGSKLRVGTGYRGGTLQDLHVSEFGKICAKRPDVAKEIITGSLEAVSKDGNATFESTAEGSQGRFYDMCRNAQSENPHSNIDFKLHFYPWYVNGDYTLHDGYIVESLKSYFDELHAKHNINLTDGQKRWYSSKQKVLKEDIFREYPSYPDEAFKMSVEGAYYKDQFADVYAEGRIGEPINDTHNSVYTAWDIGTGDHTAIWFYQKSGQEIHLIDYYQNNGKGLEHYLKYVNEKPYRYVNHYGPHDMNHRQYAKKAKTLKTLAAEGLECDGEIYSLDFDIVPMLGVNDGIALARKLMGNCYFYQVDESDMNNEQKDQCINQGVRCLESYRKEWDAKNSVWKNNPKHDWASHGADAFRYLAVIEDSIVKETSVESFRL